MTPTFVFCTLYTLIWYHTAFILTLIEKLVTDNILQSNEALIRPKAYITRTVYMNGVVGHMDLPGGRSPKEEEEKMNSLALYEFIL